MMDKDSPTLLVRVWLFGAFEVERRDGDGCWEPIEKSHWEKGYTRSLFKRLLSANGRRLERLSLIDDLWADPESPELVERYLNDAAYKLRKALRPEEVLKTFGHGSGYLLVGQSLLWIDTDACEALMGEAERIGRTSAPALPLLEQARTYFARGDFLEGESGLWVYARRGTLERLHYRCLIWLAEAYEQQGLMGQTEMLYNALLEDNPADEDVLCRLMGLLHRQGMTSQALRCYEETRKQLKHLGQRLSPATDAFAKRLLSEPRQVEAYGVKGHEKQKRLSSTSEQPPFFAVLSSNTHDKIEDIPSKAQALEHLSERIASLNTDEETLDYFEKLTESCRHLSEGSEFKLAERILWTYLPRIEAIAKLSFQNHARVASIVSQSYLLAASLAGQHNNLMKRLQFSENALLYGKVANDRNLQIAAMKQLATTLDLQGHTNEVLQAYQQTIPFLNEISPLLQSLIYSGISGTYAQLKQRQEAIRYLALAYESFPADPEKDLSFSFANGSYCALIFCDGLTHLDFHEPHKAEQIFAQIDGLHPKIQIAKKVRIALLNCQVATYIELNEMEQACIYLEEAANVAIIIGSERRFQESFTLLQQMQKVWPHELRIKQLEALFRS